MNDRNLSGARDSVFIGRPGQLRNDAPNSVWSDRYWKLLQLHVRLGFGRCDAQSGRNSADIRTGVSEGWLNVVEGLRENENLSNQSAWIAMPANLPPGSASAPRHSHSQQDEFVYILEGTPIVVTGAGEMPLRPGMCTGLKAGGDNAHQLRNRSATVAVYLEIGDRTAGDVVTYPDDDIKIDKMPDGPASRCSQGWLTVLALRAPESSISRYVGTEATFTTVALGSTAPAREAGN